MSDVIQNLPKVVEAYRRSAFNPIAGLTPEKLSRQLTEFKAGTLRDLALTMDAIEERDDTLAGVVPKAKSAVARHGYEMPLWFFEARTGKLRYIEQPYGYDGVALDPGAWMVSVGQGLMRACSVAWMFKRLSLNDWVGYCDKFGFPGIHGKTDAAKGTAEWTDMVDAVAAFANDWSAVTNRAAEISLIEAKGAGTIPFPPLVERMDRALATLWRGGDLSTMSKGDGVGSNSQTGESDIIEQDDAQWVSEQLRLKLDRLVLDYTFGEGTPALAYVKVLTSAKENITQDLAIDAFLVANGHPISQKQVAERYNRPLPDAADALLKAPAAPLQAGGSPFAPRVPGAFNERLRPALNERDAAFRLAAVEKLGAAQAEHFAPLRKRLEQILAIDDEAKQRAELTRFKASLPEYVKSLKPDSALVKTFEAIFGSALVSGATEAATAKQ